MSTTEQDIKGKVMPYLTNTIRLKKDRQYLFVFEENAGLSKESMQRFMQLLRAEGYTGLALVLKTKDALTVIEKE